VFEESLTSTPKQHKRPLVVYLSEEP